MENIRRSFGHVLALDDASLTLEAGEIHAVLGANGAGKTTLLSILAGLLRPDSGRIYLRGTPIHPSNPREAWALGIGMVHQHFTLVPRLSVLENLALGAAGLRLRTADVRARAEELMKSAGLVVPLDEPVETLGVGDRQRVEVLKVLLRRPHVLILDEPTAVLAPVEVERLLALLRALAADGTTVALVGHKLDEVLSVSDRVTVLRAGRTVLEAERSAVDAGSLVAAMVGTAGGAEAAQVETVAEGAPPTPETGAYTAPPAAGRVVARLANVSVLGARGAPALADVSLEVRQGEVVGVAGVEGNGQHELAQVLAGRRSPDAGSATIPADPSFIPQDRRREGLVADFTLTENVALALHREPEYRRGPFLRWARLRERTNELIHSFSVKAPSAEVAAQALSGGNQQRIVVARELGRSPALLVAENPTRGLDVAAAAFVHARLRELRDAGVVLISTDLDEVLRLSHRILVMARGRLLPVPEDERTREGIGRLMLAGGERPAEEPR